MHILWSDSTRYKKLTETKSQLWLTDGGYRRDYNEYIKHDKYLAVKIDEEERRPTPSGEDLALLPRRIVGYALWERKFVQLDVRFLHHVAVEDKHNPFEKLQIEPIHKTLIQSIVTSHFTRNDLENKGTALGTQDIIRGKGKGVVILLHGVPGVGKTATAEAVAQKWGRPLFPITCGDLGSTAESVEKSLNGIFRLAHLWDCVLLLDEADVFITQRTKSDLQRNALVSGESNHSYVIFLPQLTRLSIPSYVGVLQRHPIFDHQSPGSHRRGCQVSCPLKLTLRCAQPRTDEGNI